MPSLAAPSHAPTSDNGRAGPGLDLREVARNVAAFRQPNGARGVWELAVSAGPFAALWLLMLSLIHI